MFIQWVKESIIEYFMPIIWVWRLMYERLNNKTKNM